MGLCRGFSTACKESRKRPWIYLIVIFVATFSAFMTWLTLDSAGIPSESNKWWSGGVFVLVSILLLLYFISCMRRYCSQISSFSD